MVSRTGSTTTVASFLFRRSQQSVLLTNPALEASADFDLEADLLPTLPGGDANLCLDSADLADLGVPEPRLEAYLGESTPDSEPAVGHDSDLGDEDLPLLGVPAADLETDLEITARDLEADLEVPDPDLEAGLGVPGSDLEADL